MHYQGGKFRQAKAMVAAMCGDWRGRGRGRWWDPFFGGLSVAVQLAATCGPGVVSDANRALISMYQAMRDGWTPPLTGTVEEWHAAKVLPDEDPRKAFFGIGASYGAKWFGGPAVVARREWNRKQRYWCSYDPLGAAARSLVRDVPALAGCEIRCADFLTSDAPADVRLIYCDPPYAGTTSYAGVPRFDHLAFWARCREHVAHGRRVVVSEYSCPVPHKVIWSRARGCMLSGVGSGLDARADKREGARIESLYEVLACS